MALIELDNITKTYGSNDNCLEVLKNVRLYISTGQTIAVVGPSGSGKSTLLNLIGTLDQPTSGIVKINGIDINKLDDKQLAILRNEHIGFVFQDHHLLSQYSVLENILLPSLAGGNCPKAKRQRAEYLLEQIGLYDKINSRPSELSGGQKQRIALARALINEPAIVLADEPTGNLDHKTAAMLVDLLCQLNEKENITLVVATHWPELACRMDKEYYLRDGAII